MRFCLNLPLQIISPPLLFTMLFQNDFYKGTHSEEQVVVRGTMLSREMVSFLPL